MFARKALFSSIGRATVMATVAAVALTVVRAVAGSRRLRAVRQGPVDGDRDQRCHRLQRPAPLLPRWRRRCCSAAFAGIVGTGLAIAAAQNRRAYYDDYYGGGPVYYGGGPVYYGGDPYYGGYGYGFTTGVPNYRGIIRSPAGNRPLSEPIDPPARLAWPADFLAVADGR